MVHHYMEEEKDFTPTVSSSVEPVVQEDKPPREPPGLQPIPIERQPAFCDVGKSDTLTDALPTIVIGICLAFVLGSVVTTFTLHAPTD
ncbi:MAG: hypothetical protein CMJ58_06350 [Planctomycetaceae bacterium]|jgi:hypothetical protein|nr:hypothetical protein [Planctomycetaceae bacterium]